MSLDKCAIITDQCTVTVISTLLAMHLLKGNSKSILPSSFSVEIKNKIIEWFLKLFLELGFYSFIVV